MTKIDEYEARASESMAAIEASTNERDRAFHRRAYSIWRKLIAGVGEAEARAVMRPAPKPVKVAASKAR